MLRASGNTFFMDRRRSWKVIDVVIKGDWDGLEISVCGPVKTKKKTVLLPGSSYLIGHSEDWWTCLWWQSRFGFFPGSGHNWFQWNIWRFTILRWCGKISEQIIVVSIRINMLSLMQSWLSSMFTGDLHPGISLNSMTSDSSCRSCWVEWFSRSLWSSWRGPGITATPYWKQVSPQLLLITKTAVVTFYSSVYSSTIISRKKLYFDLVFVE